MLHTLQRNDLEWMAPALPVRGAHWLRGQRFSRGKNLSLHRKSAVEVLVG
jgi:hypothetical protein